MDWLAFIASLVGSLAWPGVVVALALIFRTEATALLRRPLSRAKAGPVEFEWHEVRERIVEEVKATPGVTGRPPSGVIRIEGGVPTIVTGSAQALIAAAQAMDTASTPEELAERVVEYVSLRTVPGLRGLSSDRIRLEQELFGTILEMQTQRARGAQTRDARRFAAVLESIEQFWARPELLTDEAVANTTAQVRAVIADMVEAPQAGA